MISQVHILGDQTALALFWISHLVRKQGILRAQERIDDGVQGLILNKTALKFVGGESKCPT